MLKIIRVVAAVEVFIGFNLFFLGFADGFGVLTQIQFVPACLAFNLILLGIVVQMTVFVGRLYCSVLCPLGIFQDVALWVRRRFRRTSFAFHRGRPVVRAVAAVLFVVLLLCGAASLAGLVEPYSAYGRFATHLFEPLAAACNNYVADLCMRWGHPCVLKSEIFIRGWAALGAAGVSLAALAVVAALRGRLFCNTVCPVGAVLGLLSAKAPVRIRLDASKCVKCGLCAKACKAECIDVANGKVDQSRCVRCFNCIGTCKKGALSWK